MNKLLVILGPTATGKTDLALSLAKKFSGELVSCDSRQVYKGLDIGTGKLPGSGKWEVRRGIKKWEVGGVIIWMYDVVNPQKQYTVFNYVKDADRVIRGIRERGRLPIVVGGTGFYLKALLEGLSNLAVPINKELRKELGRMSVEELQIKLQNLFPTIWENMNNSDRQNPRRLIRAIELTMSSRLASRSERMSGSKYKSQVRNWIPAYAGMTAFSTLKIGLTAPREILYKRVDKRAVKRINQGMVGEAERLYKGGLTLKRMRQLGLEYGVLADYLSGVIREIKGDKGLIKIMQNKIHRYIRRQLTWFKREKNVFWVNITTKDYPQNVEKLVAQWYDQAHGTKN